MSVAPSTSGLQSWKARSAADSKLRTPADGARDGRALITLAYSRVAALGLLTLKDIVLGREICHEQGRAWPAQLSAYRQIADSRTRRSLEATTMRGLVLLGEEDGVSRVARSSSGSGRGHRSDESIGQMRERYQPSPHETAHDGYCRIQTSGSAEEGRCRCKCEMVLWPRRSGCRQMSTG